MASIDPATNKVVARVSLSEHPDGLAFVSGSLRVGTIQSDTNTNSILRIVTLPGRSPPRPRPPC